MLILVILPSLALSAVERWWKFLTVGLSVLAVMKRCGYENDRDVIAIMNLNGRGSLTLSTAPQMRDVIPNR